MIPYSIPHRRENNMNDLYSHTRIKVFEYLLLINYIRKFALKYYIRVIYFTLIHINLSWSRL